MERYLKETPMLDFSAPSIRALIRERGWDAVSGVAIYIATSTGVNAEGVVFIEYVIVEVEVGCSAGAFIF